MQSTSFFSIFHIRIKQKDENDKAEAELKNLAYKTMLLNGTDINPIYNDNNNNNNEKITNFFIQDPKPIINNYKFIKGFEEGELK